MLEKDSPTKDKLGKIILILGTAPAFLGSGVFVVIGLLSILSLLQGNGWGMIGVVLFLLPGSVVFGLACLSVLGPRNISLTILGAVGNILAGILLPVFLIFAWEWSLSNSDFLIIFATPVFAGISALLAWWLRGLISVSYVLSASIATLIAIGAFIFGPQVDKALRYSTIQELPAHSSRIFNISWAPNGRYLVAGAENGKLIIWDIEEKAPVQTLAAPQADRSNALAAWSPNGQLIAGFSLQDNGGVMSLVIYDAQSGALLQQHNAETLVQPVSQLIWSPDNKRILLLPSLFIWDVETGKYEIFDVSEQLKIRAETPKAILWSPDGELLMVTHGTEFASNYNLVRYLYIRDVKTWQILSKMEVEHEPKNVSFSPDMKFYLADTNITEWETGKTVTAQGYDGNAHKITWTPNGEKVAALQRETVTVWDISGAKGKVFNPDKDDRILDMAWSPDGTALALISHNQKILIWNSVSP